MPGAAESCLCRCATSSTGGSVRLRLVQVLRRVEILQPHHRRDDGAFGLGTTWRELWPKLGDEGLRQASYRGGSGRKRGGLGTRGSVWGSLGGRRKIINKKWLFSVKR